MWLSPALCHGRESQLTAVSYDVSELTCDVVLTSVSESFSEKKSFSLRKCLCAIDGSWLPMKDRERERGDLCSTTNGSWLQSKGS